MLNQTKNFTDIYKWIADIRSAANDQNPLNTVERSCAGLKNALNKSLQNLHCFEVKYTPNFDKQFFGVYVTPSGIPADELSKKLLKGYCDLDGEFTPFSFNQYSLELDGKLLREFAFLSTEQLWSIIYAEIVTACDRRATEKLRNMIDSYIALTRTRICPDTVLSYPLLFDMMCRITIHNITSLFARYDVLTMDEIPQAIRDAGLESVYASALEALTTAGMKPDEVDTSGVMMNWYFSNYMAFDNNRYVEFMLRDSMSIEASSLVRNMCFNALKQITRVTAGDYNYYSVSVNEAGKRKGLLYQMKRNGMKSIEEDLFEYNMRLRNVETQDDAILLMRQINSRMSILEDYLREEDMDEKDRERWEDCYKKYLELREALSKKTVYNKKMYGLFVDYNALQNMSQSGQLMNTYY